MSVIQSLVSADEALINGLLEAADRAIETVSFKPSIGLTEGRMDNVQIKQGDLILDPAEKTIFIATGQFHQGKPVVANQAKKKVIEPELLVVGNMASTPLVQRAAQKLAIKHPDRRVLVYGDAQPQPEAPVEDLSMAESVEPLLAQLAKKADKANPVSDQPLPTKDEHVRPASLKTYMANIQASKDKTTTGSTVKNDKTPWLTFIKAAGKTEDGTPGDDNPGNGICPKDKTKGEK
jgi:hypothetical protein